MIPELGHFALWLALGVSLVQGILPLVGAQRGRSDLMAMARPGARTLFALIAFAFACLAFSFARNDFSVLNVASNSNTALPLQLTNQLSQLYFRQAEEWKRENERLRDYFNILRQYPFKPKMARVVARDPVNWWKTVTIDRGSRDGVLTNAAVVTPEGLVGRVSGVSFAQSQVVLVGDPDCRVSVLVGEDKSREQGVIAPASSSPLDHALVDLSYLSRNSKLVPGQIVVTSGMGGVFPKGIVVGQIADSRSMGYGLYKEAQVRLAVNMNRLEEVFVLMP